MGASIKIFGPRAYAWMQGAPMPRKTRNLAAVSYLPQVHSWWRATRGNMQLLDIEFLHLITLASAPVDSMFMYSAQQLWLLASVPLSASSCSDFRSSCTRKSF